MIFLRYVQLGVALMAVFFLALGSIRMAGASGLRKGLPQNPNEGRTFNAANIREVVLAGGCFWGVQAFLELGFSRTSSLRPSGTGYVGSELQSRKKRI